MGEATNGGLESDPEGTDNQHSPKQAGQVLLYTVYYTYTYILYTS